MALAIFSSFAALFLLLGSITDGKTACTSRRAMPITLPYCKGQSIASVRLSSKVAGTNPWEGVLEMLVDDVWNAVCNEWFTYNFVPQTLACHELGYPGFDSYVENYTAYYGSFYSSSAVDFIHCSGSENSIRECGITTGTCPPASYVAMKCQPPPSNGLNHNLMNYAPNVTPHPPTPVR